MKRTGLFLTLALVVVGLGFTQSASTGRIISESIKNGYVEVTIYLPGEGSIDCSGWQSSRGDTESLIQDIRASAHNGSVVLKNITASINPAIKNYMKDRNMRIMEIGGDFSVYVIRSTNPESFEQVTYREGLVGRPLFLPPEDDDIGLPPELPSGW
jgi:hypothetical protein